MSQRPNFATCARAASGKASGTSQQRSAIEAHALHTPKPPCESAYSAGSDIGAAAPPEHPGLQCKTNELWSAALNRVGKFPDSPKLVGRPLIQDPRATVVLMMIVNELKVLVVPHSVLAARCSAHCVSRNIIAALAAARPLRVLARSLLSL